MICLAGTAQCTRKKGQELQIARAENEPESVVVTTSIILGAECLVPASEFALMTGKDANQMTKIHQSNGKTIYVLAICVSTVLLGLPATAQKQRAAKRQSIIEQSRRNPARTELTFPISVELVGS